MPTPSTVAYAEDFKPPVELSCGLLMVPHGQTPSNVGLLFQNYSEGAANMLTAAGEEAARRGAAAFTQARGAALAARPEAWRLYRSPLRRTEQTAAPYLAALREAGVPVLDPVVDPDLLEINQGSWHGYSVESLEAAGRHAEAAAAREYRAGSFVAKPVDGSGESLLDVTWRAAAWLRSLEARHGGGKQNVMVFGHGTFQNAVEVLLRTYPEKAPSQVFSRVSGGSHLRRGEVHVLAEPR